MIFSRWPRFCMAAALCALAPAARAGLDANSTVFLIVMENHNWSQILNSTSAPYINKSLLPMASYASQYYNPPGIHPSEPNYLWLEAGTNFGIANDNAPSSNKQTTTSHLVTLLNAAGVSWKTYQEGIPGNTVPTSNISATGYAVKHNPFAYFTDVTGNTSYAVAHMRPYTELAADLKNNTLTRYNFITPNLCDDMHDTCSPLNDQVKQGDNWLAAAVPPILASDAYKNGGAVFITWDEGEGGDGPIGMIVLSPFAKGGGYVSNVHTTHGSTLKTLQRIFGVGPYLRDAAAATTNDLSDFFNAGALGNTVATPSISTSLGAGGSVIVTLATPTPGAVIHFTMDGTTPTAASPAYTGPFSVTPPVTVEAYAVKPIWNDSAVAVDAITVTPPAPYVMADAAYALFFAAGFDVATSTDVQRFEVETDPPSSGVIDIADALRIARKAAGLDANP